MMLTSADLIEMSGGVMAVTGVVVALMKGGFCAREMPIWLRVWLFIALSLLGTRLLTRENSPIPLDEYWVSLIYIHAATTMFLAACWAVSVTIGPGGDRCPNRVLGVPNVQRRLAWIVVGIALLVIGIIIVVFIGR